VPNEALPRIAAGPAASLFDRVRDLATNRGTDDKWPYPSPRPRAR
jgi:hypothetical protein